LLAAAKLGQSLWEIAQGLVTSEVTAAHFQGQAEPIADVRILRQRLSQARVTEITRRWVDRRDEKNSGRGAFVARSLFACRGAFRLVDRQI
jgi:hypothetical protein